MGMFPDTLEQPNTENIQSISQEVDKQINTHSTTQNGIVASIRGNDLMHAIKQVKKKKQVIFLGPSTMVQWVELMPVLLASHRGMGSSPACFTLEPASS